jgi:hypothetical protein
MTTAVKRSSMCRYGVSVMTLAVATSVGCAVDSMETATLAQEARSAPSIDVRRSLAITEQPILARFSLQRVLQQIIDTSGVSGITPAGLFQQWWDTQNPGPGLARGAHCDTALVDGGPSLNGYPYVCRPSPAEGAQASCDPFVAGSPCAYLPIGLFMRFDLAPASGTHCGEYRIVYAKQTGRTSGADRSLVIFEAAMRNPHYNQGIRGCQKLVRAWADLSTESSLAARADALEQMYFDGYREFDPIIQASNFGDNGYGAGQVRTNQFMQPSSPRVWLLREFKIRKDCAGNACSLRFAPVSDKTNPFGPLFGPASAHPRAPSFQAELVAKVDSLATSDINALGMSTDDAFNSGQSLATSSTPETDYVANFGAGSSPFRAAIQDRLTGLGSSLTPDDIVRRAQALSCAGCHRFSSGVDIGGTLLWPPSLGFTHVSERDADLEVIGGVTRYRLSLALTDVFLPHRKQLAEDFLDDVPHPSRPPDDPIGGRWTH